MRMESAAAGKSDLKSAFRHLGIKPSDWCLLVMKAESPIDNKMYYFIDKCLPFGASISCAHFQDFSDALSYIVKCKTLRDNINYLDDFFFAAARKWLCDNDIQVFLNVCRDINFPVSMDKTQWGTDLIIFLGLLIDTRRRKVFIPIEKVERAMNLIQRFLAKKKGTIEEVQQLCGILNFFSKCIIPARAFTRRMYSMLEGQLAVMKKHHHISLKSDVRTDLELWQVFLRNPSVYARNFCDFSNTYTANDIDMFTDSSANPELGCGGYCGSAWFAAQWSSFVKEVKPSINYLELYAVTVAVVLWVERFRDQKIALFCDNMSVVNMINNSSSTCRNCMVLIRIIVLQGLIHNVSITAKHVMGSRNAMADALSRKKFNTFRQMSNGRHDLTQTPIPEELWPIDKLWLF